MFYSFLSQWDWWQRAEVLAIQGAEAESSQASGLPERQSELKVMLGNLVKPCLRTESEGDAEDVVQGLRADLACEALRSVPSIGRKIIDFATIRSRLVGSYLLDKFHFLSHDYIPRLNPSHFFILPKDHILCQQNMTFCDSFEVSLELVTVFLMLSFFLGLSLLGKLK